MPNLHSLRNDNQKPLRIWLIQHGEPPPTLIDSGAFRTARLSRELAARGHDVTYWTSSFWHHKKILYCEDNRVETVDGYKLRILHAGKYDSNHSIQRYMHHKKMARLFAEESRKLEKPDVIVAALPIHYCALEAVKYAMEVHVPVIVDIRNYWPDNFLLLFPKRLEWLGRLFFWNDFQVTKQALKNATSLVSMMGQLLDWGLAQYAGRHRGPDDQVFFLGGDKLDTSTNADALTLFPEIVERIDERFVVSYVGSFSHFNHPMVIIEAAKRLKSMGFEDQFLFLLAGAGDYHDTCVSAAAELNNVLFPGWVETKQISALNTVSSVGVVPSIEEYTFPNKVFSYLGSGLPILSSAKGDLKDLLAEHNAGYYFDILDPLDLANRLLELSQLDGSSVRLSPTGYWVDRSEENLTD